MKLLKVAVRVADVDSIRPERLDAHLVAGRYERDFCNPRYRLCEALKRPRVMDHEMRCLMRLAGHDGVVLTARESRSDYQGGDDKDDLCVFHNVHYDS